MSLFEWFYDVPLKNVQWGAPEAGAVLGSFLSLRFLRGTDARVLEDTVRRLVGAHRAVAFERGRSALRWLIEIAAAAPGARNRREVIFPALLCRAVWEAVLAAGCEPVLCDVTEDLAVDPSSAEQVFHPDRTLALVVPHIYGRPTNVAPFLSLAERSGAVVLDDAAAALGAREYSIVTSGAGIRREEELLAVEQGLARVRRETALMRCASLGNLDGEALARLKAAGLETFHHNLECARSFFPRICTTHAYEEDVATVRRAREAGLRVCSGGIFGLGERPAQRVELAETLRDLDVDSVPINFLNPIPGTPLEGRCDLTPLDCLRIIAVFRLMLPEKDIVVCGGREKNLRDLQSWIFLAGANGMLVGDYLTTTGRDGAADLQMVRDLGLEVLPPGESVEGAGGGRAAAAPESGGARWST